MGGHCSSDWFRQQRCSFIFPSRACFQHQHSDTSLYMSLSPHCAVQREVRSPAETLRISPTLPRKQALWQGVGNARAWMGDWGSNSVLHPSAQGAPYLYTFICLGFTWVMSSTHEQGHCQLPSLLYSNSCSYLSFCSLNAYVRVTRGSEHERTWCLWLGGFTIKGLGYSCLSQHSSE